MIFFLALPLWLTVMAVLLGLLIALYLGVEFDGYDIWLAALTVLIWGIAAIVVFWSANMADQAEWDEWELA